MSAGNPFTALTAGQDTGQNTAPASSNGNPFSAIAATIPPTDQPNPNSLTWDMVKNNVQSIADGTNPNVQQLKDAAIGAGKSITKGFANIGDIATLGLTHLIPGSEKSSGGINSTGTALNPTNDDQRYGGYVGDAATFELGNQIFSSLSKLPLAARLLQTAKALKVAQEHPVLSHLAAKAISGAAEAGGSTLIASGDPKTALEGAAVGGVVAPVAEAAGKAVQYVRDIYKPLETAEAVQPVLQDAIRDVAASTAKDAEVAAPTSTSIRDTVADLAESVKAKSQPIFQKIDELSDGKFSDAQAQAAKYRGSLDSVGKDRYESALQTQNDIFESVKDKMEPDALAKAKANWKQFNALSDVSDALQKTVSGSRPEIAAASKAAQPAETVNAKALAGKLNQLYNEGVLQTAFGNRAHELLDHTGAAQQRLVSIADATASQNSRKRTVNYVAKRAAGVALGGGALTAIEGHKLIDALKK